MARGGIRQGAGRKPAKVKQKAFSVRLTLAAIEQIHTAARARPGWKLNHVVEAWALAGCQGIPEEKPINSMRKLREELQETKDKFDKFSEHCEMNTDVPDDVWEKVSEIADLFAEITHLLKDNVH